MKRITAPTFCAQIFNHKKKKKLVIFLQVPLLVNFYDHGFKQSIFGDFSVLSVLLS